jgi:hypothetical protein
MALATEASRRGTTPEALAAQLIESQLPTPRSEAGQHAKPVVSKEATVYDRWQKHLEAIEADTTPRNGPMNQQANEPVASPERTPGNMYERLKAHLESLPKPAPGTPKTDYSQDTGRRFAEALVEKRRQGRL